VKEEEWNIRGGGIGILLTFTVAVVWNEAPFFSGYGVLEEATFERVRDLAFYPSFHNAYAILPERRLSY